MAYGCKKVVYGGLFSCCLLNVLVLCGLAAAIWVLAPTILVSQVNQVSRRGQIYIHEVDFGHLGGRRCLHPITIQYSGFVNTTVES